MDLYRQNSQFLLAEKICQTLQGQGFQALLAGGCVRDFLLARQPADFDVATSATPDQVESLFLKTIPVGKKFGVIVVIDELNSAQVEVASFRKDGDYQDGRRPESIELTDAKEDSQRRDFTVNGLFYDLVAKKVLDYVDGLEDLNLKKIRAIGNPILRFKEDHLRLLRAVRFSSQLGFEIEAQTLRAISSEAPLIRTVSGERIQEELTKLLLSQWLEKGLQILLKTELLSSLLFEAGENPEFEKLVLPSPFTRQEEAKSKEDLWFRFFFWLNLQLGSRASLSFFEALCNKWKFSRELKQKSLKALRWVFEERVFLHHPLGELLALSYDSENLRGLMEYSEFYLKQEDEKLCFEKFLSRRLALGREKPTPWVNASDIPHIKGEALGQTLRLCYWEQLEGTAKKKEDLARLLQ